MTNNSWDKNSWAKTYRHDRWDKQRKTWNTFSGDKTEGQVQFSEFFNYNPLISKPAHKPNQCRVWSHNCTVVTVHTVRGGGGDVGNFHRGHGLSRILHGLTSSVFLTKRHYFQLSKFILGWTRRNNNKKTLFFFRFYDRFQLVTRVRSTSLGSAAVREQWLAMGNHAAYSILNGIFWGSN